MTRRSAGRRAAPPVLAAPLAAALAALALLPARPALAQEAHRAILADKLRDELRAIARGTPGVVGAHVIDLTSGERFGVNDTLPFPQGSAIKIPLLLELYAQAESGALSLGERVPVRRADQVAGTGIAQHFADGASALSLRDLAVLMIVLSDNTATNMLADRVGMEAVNRRMASLGSPRIRFQRKMIRPDESARGNENLATPAEAAALMARIARCEVPVGAERCAEMRRILEIPKAGSLPAPLPATLAVAWKPGTIEGVETAWGIVNLPGRPYVVAVMVNYSDAAAAAEAVRRTSEAAFQHFRRLAGATPYGTRVAPELLQRVRP